MKNLLKIFSLILFLFSTISSVFVEAAWPTSETSSTWESITIKVTEKIPGAWCSNIKDSKTNLYKCTISPWFDTIELMMWQIVKWFTAITALAWVLFIVVNWILLSIWWDWKDEIKKRIIKTLSWLVLLLLSWVILSIIAPWVYR